MADTLETASLDEAQEAGFLGVRADPTPNESYTVAGVTSGAPTPETDEGAKKAASDRRAELEARFGGNREEAAAPKATSKSSA